MKQARQSPTKVTVYVSETLTKVNTARQRTLKEPSMTLPNPPLVKVVVGSPKKAGMKNTESLPVSWSLN